MNENMKIIIGDLLKEEHVFDGHCYGDFLQNRDIKPFIAVFKDYLEHKGFSLDFVNLCIRYPREIGKDVEKAVEIIQKAVAMEVNNASSNPQS